MVCWHEGLCLMQGAATLDVYSPGVVGLSAVVDVLQLPQHLTGQAEGRCGDGYEVSLVPE